MQTDYIHIILADDDEDDRLFFTDAFSELKINTKVQTYNDGVELMNYLNSDDAVLPQVLFLDLNILKKKKWDRMSPRNKINKNLMILPLLFILPHLQKSI